MNHEECIAALRSAGVIGQGGAGFPSHVKYAAKAEVVIANGCECEPLLATDRYLMVRHAELLAETLSKISIMTGAKRCVIALKAKNIEAANKLRKVIPSSCEMVLLPDFYPAGDEQTLAHVVTGKTVPPLGIPPDIGVLVTNVGTLISAGQAMRGIPVTHKTITVTGDVAAPGILEVPIGSSIHECLATCGGVTAPDPVYILGGPLMGRIVDSAAILNKAVVTKTLGGIIVIPRGHVLHANARQKTELLRRRAAAACIQCRLCTELCPRYCNGHPFETHRVMRAFAAGAELTSESARQALLCCECGICEYVACPMGLSPRRINIAVKNRLRDQGQTYQGERGTFADMRLFSEYRRIPTARLAQRIDIAPYMGIKPKFTTSSPCSHVCIPLKQHIGAAALPVVATGDLVRENDLLAEIPQGSLGARVHAGIDGIVTVETDAIHIQRT